ncbi:MAG: hypothetical protein ACK40G_17045 [Cytophagaceae bacterium]
MQRVVLIIFFLFTAMAGARAQYAPKMLLADENIQMESTEAVNAMYNFKFDIAEAKFLELKQRYPWHPMPYFLMALSAWWKIMPNTDIEKYDNTFIAYIDSSIAVAEKLYKDNDKNNYEAAFFLAAAHGFKGRLYGEARKKYSKAAMEGKEALHYLSKFGDNNDLSPEFLFGKALFNYYEVWIKEEYPILRPLMAFFPNGDKQLGLKQLKEVSYNAFYTRTEAQYFLMRIYYLEEEDYHKAFPVARYLASTFPDNPYFHRMYAMLAFVTGQRSEAEVSSLSILEKLEKGYPGYEERAARYATYFLGNIYRFTYKDNIKAKSYFQQMIIYSEKIGATDSYYYFSSLANLAQMADQEKDVETAKKYYKTILKKAEKKDALYKEAKNYLDPPKQKDKKKESAKK